MVIEVPALVWLLGPSGAGKTSWALERFGRSEVVSSDALRAVVGTGESDLDASADAFAVLESIASARLRRGLTVVVDSLGFDLELLDRLGGVAAEHGVPVLVVAFDTPAEVCRERNGNRSRPVPAGVLTRQLKTYEARKVQLESEGRILQVAEDQAIVVDSRHREHVDVDADRKNGATELSFFLHVSQFEWCDRKDLGAELARLARMAEEIGFDGISVMDHLRQIPQVGRAWEAIPEAFTALSFMAGATERLRLSPLVANVTLREPALLGKMVATLDVMSGGRAECALGAGWFEAEQTAYGIRFPSVSERLDRLEDTLRLLPVLWGPGSKTFEGTTLSVPEAACYPRPLQQRIPIVVGGAGERRTMRMAAELADGWNSTSADPERLGQKLEVLHSHCRAIDRDPADLSVSVLDPTVVGRDRTEVGELVERVRGRRPAKEVAARLKAGTTSTTISRYRRMVGLGVDRVYVSFADLDGPGAAERFAPVIDAFR